MSKLTPDQQAQRRAAQNAKRTQRRVQLARKHGAAVSPIAFARRDDARHALDVNPNRGKRHLQDFDRDSATAKRDGAPTRGARLARQSPLGNRGVRKFEARIPSLGQIRA